MDEREGGKEMSRKAFLIALAVILVMVAGMLAWVFSKAEAEKTWDVSYEMTNTNISWQQTFYPGTWGGV